MRYGYHDRVKRTGLRGAKSTTGRHYKRHSALKTVYKQKPTRYNQKRQIARVTRLAISNRQRFKSVYTDWQMSPTSAPDDTGYQFPMLNSTWQIIRLTNFDQWIPVLRQDTNVEVSNHTFVKRIQVNMRASLGNGYVNGQWFLVRTRFPEANRDLFSAPPTIANGDFVEVTSAPGMNIRLNPAKFKVLASTYATLKTTTITTPATTDFLPGDPSPAEKKWQWNISPKIKVHKPATQSTPGRWPEKAFETLPYYDRLYIMGYTNIDTNTMRGFWYADPLATCVINL